ncbi:MAG: tail fiber domain-containing protein [Reyranella sp.]|uniref:tail fiber domain-containing protein n=1 Tax=Reyranella sp. TaxID=1929291 RepID=UPI003D0EF41D
MALNFGAFSDIGSGVQSLFSAKGSRQNAASLDEAARLTEINARISKASTGIQLAATQRDIYRVLGGQRADIAGAGFSMSGTALDLAADSAAQGAIARGLVTTQGAIEEQGFRIQAQNLRAEAQAARSAAKSSSFGGFLSIATGVLGLFSDKRQKENIKKIGVGKRGLPVFTYTYKADPEKTEWVGYMAQDVEKVEPSMVIDMGVKFIDSEYAPQRTGA